MARPANPLCSTSEFPTRERQSRRPVRRCLRLCLAVRLAVQPSRRPILPAHRQPEELRRMRVPTSRTLSCRAWATRSSPRSFPRDFFMPEKLRDYHALFGLDNSDHELLNPFAQRVLVLVDCPASKSQCSPACLTIAGTSSESR